MRSGKGVLFTLVELVFMILVCLLLIALLLLALRPVEKIRIITCASNLKQLGLGLTQYAADSGGKFCCEPGGGAEQSLDLLRTNSYVTDTKIYTCFSTTTPRGDTDIIGHCDYKYGALYMTNADPVDSPLMRDKKPSNKINHDGFGYILFLDGHAGRYDGASWATGAHNKNIFLNNIIGD